MGERERARERERGERDDRRESEKGRRVRHQQMDRLMFCGFGIFMA